MVQLGSHPKDRLFEARQVAGPEVVWPVGHEAKSSGGIRFVVPVIDGHPYIDLDT